MGCDLGDHPHRWLFAAKVGGEELRFGAGRL